MRLIVFIASLVLFISSALFADEVLSTHKVEFECTIPDHGGHCNSEYVNIELSSEVSEYDIKVRNTSIHDSPVVMFKSLSHEQEGSIRVQVCPIISENEFGKDVLPLKGSPNRLQLDFYENAVLKTTRYVDVIYSIERGY